MGGKLFSSYRTVFELAQGLRDSKTSDFCVLSLSSVLEKGSYICIVMLAYWREGTPWRKSPLFSHIPNIFICCKYIIKARGKKLSLIAFYKLFLSDIKVKISVFSKRKVLRWYTQWASFIDIGYVVLQF